MRPEPLEERRRRLTSLLSRGNKVLRDGIQLSEAITVDGAAIFRPSAELLNAAVEHERQSSPGVVLVLLQRR